MDKRFNIVVAGALTALLMTSCSKEEPKQAEPVKQAESAPKKAQDMEAADKTAGIEPTIDARHRNPFQSHIIVMKGAEDGAKKAVKGPLECCELNTFKIMAVVSSPENAFALVQAPDSKRYIVRKGDKMGANEGRIVKIAKSSITVREPNKDEKGIVVSTTDIELNLSYEKTKESVRR